MPKDGSHIMAKKKEHLNPQKNHDNVQMTNFNSKLQSIELEETGVLVFNYSTKCFLLFNHLMPVIIDDRVIIGVCLKQVVDHKLIGFKRKLY